jgi:hypothetical protein
MTKKKKQNLCEKKPQKEEKGMKNSYLNGVLNFR